MKKLRKVNTKKRKQARKDAQEALASQAALMQSHPTECCLCQSPFTRTHETVKSWHVTIKEERVRLTCPDCWSTIKEVVAKEQKR